MDENFPGAFHPHFTYVSVGGVSTPGKLGGGIEVSFRSLKLKSLCQS